jgi:hypothetical protein
LIRNGFPGATWVETGTYLGATTELLARHGSSVYSIEPQPILYENAKVHFSLFRNVEIINGLSEDIFPVLLPTLSGDVNFWLDGHFSGGVTHKGSVDTPIVEELEAVSSNMKRFSNICVMVDDVRCFNPEVAEYSAYPPLIQLVEWAEGAGLRWHVEHDIFIAKTR